MKELAVRAKNFAESVKGKQKVIINNRQQMMKEFVRSVLFEHPDSRVILTSYIIDQVIFPLKIKTK